SLKSTYPSKFEDPVIVPLQEFAWDQYLQEKKRLFTPADGCPSVPARRFLRHPSMATVARHSAGPLLWKVLGVLGTDTLRGLCGAVA
ncbi:hypothetical protein MC885_007360, partial [Smutsia gigantea]